MSARPGYREFYVDVATDPSAHDLVHVSRSRSVPRPRQQAWGCDPDCYYLVLSSYDDGELARLGPGRPTCTPIRHAIERGFRRFDFTIGDEPYKRDWSDIEIKTPRSSLGGDGPGFSCSGDDTHVSPDQAVHQAVAGNVARIQQSQGAGRLDQAPLTTRCAEGKQPMRHTEICIVGGGLAGSTAAAMLGRAGIDALLIDPLRSIRRIFAARSSTDRRFVFCTRPALPRRPAGGDARRRSVDRAPRPSGRQTAQRPVRHSLRGLVNTLRGEIPERTIFVHGKAAGISTAAIAKPSRFERG